MPRIVEYTPAWLTRPSMGFEIFSNAAKDDKNDKTNGSTAPKSSVERLMVRRGTQIFIVVDNELRWTDLVYLKDWYESESKARPGRTPAATESNYPETIFRVRSSLHVLIRFANNLSRQSKPLSKKRY
jgi:nucleoporin NUP82